MAQEEKKEALNEKIDGYVSKIEKVWKVADKSEQTQQHLLIILRGFPGSGKSTLCKAFKKYFGESDCVSCSFDKYHWKGGIFKFDPSIHRQTKQWCKEEIISSFIASKSVIVVDNAHLAKWQYAEYIVKYAEMYKYKVLVLEIKSESGSISIYQHIEHLNKNKEISECLLCKMQHMRCKMRIKKEIYTKFINQYERDANAIILEPKLNKNEKWTNEEIAKLMQMKKEIDYTQYDDEEWHKSQHRKKNKRFQRQQKGFNLDMSLDEMEKSNGRYKKRRKFNHHNRRNYGY